MVHAESGNVHVVSRLLDAHAFMDAQDKVYTVEVKKVSINVHCSTVETESQRRNGGTELEKHRLAVNFLAV